MKKDLVLIKTKLEQISCFTKRINLKWAQMTTTLFFLSFIVQDRSFEYLKEEEKKKKELA